MCGITGWVDFSRDLTTESTTLDAMVRTLIRRGPTPAAAGSAPTPRSDTGAWRSST